MAKKVRPWSAYALRVLCSALLFGSSYALLVQSTFALRMRGDLPVGAIVLALSALLGFLPLLAGRRYLGALVVSGFLAAGLGGYWWTTIPWDEFIKDSGFPTSEPPTLMHYLLVASPGLVCAFYAVASRPSTLRADLLSRGADRDEARHAAAVSFLSGAALLVVCGALSFALWLLMASGLVFAAFAPVPVGVPALVLVGALVTVAYALLARRLPVPRLPRVGLPRARAPAEGAKRGLLARIARWRAARS